MKRLRGKNKGDLDIRNRTCKGPEVREHGILMELGDLRRVGMLGLKGYDDK